MRLFKLVLLVLALAAQTPAHANPRDVQTEEANRALVIAFYNRVFNAHEVAAGAKVLAESYKQHNPEVPDGKQPFVDYFTGYFKENPEARSQIVRSATDGDLVWLHIHDTTNKADRGRAVVDIFRVKDGQIVEHWDVIQPVPAEAANSNTMF